MTVTFDLLFRHESQDTVIGTWQQTLTPRPVGFDAQAIDLTIDAPAFNVSAGDQLVFRYAGEMGLAMHIRPKPAFRSSGESAMSSTMP